MRIMVAALLTFVLLASLPGARAIGGPVQTGNLSPGELSHIERNVAHALVWHMYWSEGRTELELRKWLSEAKLTDYVLCSAPSEDLRMYLHQYLIRVDLTEIGKKHLGFDVEEYLHQANDTNEARKLYSQTLSHEHQVLRMGTLRVHLADISVLNFDKPKDPRYSAVTNLVVTNLLRSSWLKKDAAAGVIKESLILHVGGFNTESPWIYYFVDGTPYVGMMLVDPASVQFIHDDFWYMHENSHEAELQNIFSVIRRTGAQIKLKLPPHFGSKQE